MTINPVLRILVVVKGTLMKSLHVVAFAVILLSATASAQFKSQIDNQPSASQYLVHPSGFSSLLSWFNPDNFRMQQSISMNYFTFGGQSQSLASYTNSMFYKIADPLDVRFDVTLQGSPFGGQSGMFQQNGINKLFLSRAELNYRPWQNFFVRVQYAQMPLGYYGWYMNSPYSTLPGEY